MRRLGRLAVGLIALGCTPAHLKQARIDVDAKLRAGCTSVTNCKALHNAALDVLSECQKFTPGKCDKDKARTEGTFAMVTEASNRDRQAEREASEAERRRLAEVERERHRPAEEAATREQAARKAEQEQAEAKRAAEHEMHARARVALALQMLAPGYAEREAAAEAIVASVPVPDSDAFGDDRYAFVVVFARKTGWKPGSAALVSAAAQDIQATKEACITTVGASGRWEYRYLGLDERHGSTCGLKQFASGLTWQPLPKEPAEIAQLPREWLGLRESVIACERGLSPKSQVMSGHKVFQCPGAARVSAPARVKPAASPLHSIASELRAMHARCAAPRTRGLETECMALLRSSKAQAEGIQARLQQIPKNEKGWVDLGTAAYLIESCCACSEQGATMCPKVQAALSQAASEMR